MEEVILVDEEDNPVGTEEKLKAHINAKLHRAFSIYIFNSKGEFLIHQRALAKYHCPGIWANTCCSHPSPDESLEQAAHRRLKEEMGFDAELKEIMKFIYKIKFDNGLTEHEFLHVLTGKSDAIPQPNTDEVNDWKWVNLKDLKKDIKKNPGKYAYWFKVTMEKMNP
jgi:isopentenyl-diphosphate delta-isomerase